MAAPRSPGTDNALVNGLLHIIIGNDWHDQAYIDERCEGFDDLWDVVREYTPQRVSEITGVPEEQLLAAAELYARTPRPASSTRSASPSTPPAPPT